MTDQASAYSRAGVSIDAANRAKTLISAAVKSTYTPQVLAGLGAFGGMFDASLLKEMTAPVLVASTDGVGTKTKVAARMNQWDTIGQDLVNHCINDILVQGARPLFMLDYLASSRIDPEQAAALVAGVATACRAANCALIGGETAEMPGVYEPGEIDIAGMIIGVVERARVIDGTRIQAGDAILGLPSTGLHTNGFSLARRALADLDWRAPHPDLGGMSPGEALLAVHRSYLPDLDALWNAEIDVHGLVHITGGGLLENPPRVLADGLGIVLRRESWPEPPIFELIQRLGNVSTHEMCRVFNMGLGMLVILPADQLEKAQKTLDRVSFHTGEVVSGNQQFTLRETYNAATRRDDFGFGHKSASAD